MPGPATSSVSSGVWGAPEAADALRTDYLLEGSVRRAGERVRLSVQLVRGTDAHTIWAERFEEDGAEAGVTTSPLEVAAAIATADVGSITLVLIAVALSAPIRVTIWPPDPVNLTFSGCIATIRRLSPDPVVAPGTSCCCAFLTT